MNLPTIPLSRKRILVLDAEAQSREMLARALEIEGYDVKQATDPGAAMQALQPAAPDLILVDISMSNGDGIGFYQAVRKEPRWLAIPIIFLTPNLAPTERQKLREMGVEDQVAKPAGYDNLDSLVRVINARLLRSSELQVTYLNQAYLETVKVLANTIEGRDPYTHGHVERVAMYAHWLVEELNWPEDQLRRVEFGARLHDIGKIIVPDHILNKPGVLTSDEWNLMKQHTSAGAKILRNISHLQMVIPYVLYHHERWNGSGYPYGLKGREIPIEGRVLAIVDVYDALTTTRPYHPARPHHEVVHFLQNRAGTHFDPDLTGVFIQALEKRNKIRNPAIVQ